ncbi:MAG: hypothetical protein U0Z26_03855 [Anaerolineales bacterium]
MLFKKMIVFFVGGCDDPRGTACNGVFLHKEPRYSKRRAYNRTIGEGFGHRVKLSNYEKLGKIFDDTTNPASTRLKN